MRTFLSLGDIHGALDGCLNFGNKVGESVKVDRVNENRQREKFEQNSDS